MAHYYVNNNAQPTGEHEVHTSQCSFFTSIHSKTYLGDFTDCRDALAAARRLYSKVDGCFYCARTCHRG